MKTSSPASARERGSGECTGPASPAGLQSLRERPSSSWLRGHYRRGSPRIRGGAGASSWSRRSSWTGEGSLIWIDCRAAQTHLNVEELDCAFERAEAGKWGITLPQQAKINPTRQGQLVQSRFISAPRRHVPRQPLLNAANRLGIADEGRTWKQTKAFDALRADQLPPSHARQAREKEGFEFAVRQDHRRRKWQRQLA